MVNYLLPFVQALFALLLYSPFAAQAANPIDEWRTSADRVRLLAENNAPRAYQEAKELQANMPANAGPSDTAKVLNLLARIEIYLAETKQATTDAKAALDLATRHGDRIGMAEAELNIALNSVNEANIDDLKRSTMHSLELLEGVNRPDLLGESMLRTAMMYRRFGQIDESVRMTVQAMEIARHSQNPLVLLYAHQGLAISFDQSDHIEEAYQHFLQMRALALAAGAKLQEAYALSGLGGVVAKKGNLKEGEALIRESIVLFREVGAPFGMAHGMHGLVGLLQSQGHYKEAAPYLEEIISIFEHHPHKIGLWFTLNTRSKNYQMLGNAAAAMADAERAYRLATEIGLPLYISESAQRIAALAADKGDYKRAYALSNKAAEMNNKVAQEKINTRVIELMQSYESESKKRQIDELTRRTEQQAAELEQRELKQRWLWTVLGGSVFMLAGTAFFLFRLRQSHRMQEIVNTQLQHSQNALEKQTDILQSILDSMGDGVSVANELGELVLVNPAGEKITGFGTNGGHYSQWSQKFGAYLPDQVTRYPVNGLPLVRATRGESCDGEEMFLRNPMMPEGRWLSVTARPLKDKNGIVRGGVVVYSDITARKRNEEEIRALNANLEQKVQARTAELRQQTRYLRALIDALPWWVWLKDTQSRYLAVNQAAADTCGMRADDLVGKSDLDVRPRELAEAYRADDLEVMISRQKKTVEEPQITASGTIWMETFKGAVLDEDGTVLGTVGFARDISERKAAEAARETALKEAQRLAQARSDFLAQMSHELRTPLNGILGYAQILLRDKKLDQRQIAGLTIIQKSGEHLLTLITDVLDFAKIEAKKMELYPNDVPLARFLRVLCEMVEIKASQKHLAFVHEFAPDLPQVIHADEKRLRQVLLNLLSNAVKFTERGRIAFRVTLSAPDTLHFEVEDSGIGIAEDDLEHIFQPFEQAGTAHHRIGGTGLGLAISRQYARLMGSDIHVLSRLGEGSKFWLDLKIFITQAETVPAATESIIVGYRGARRHILVVDDIEENRSVLVDMLQQLGFEISEAKNGIEGLEKTRNLHPDLILMDIVMPEMDGLELTRRLRALPEFEHLPIVAVSASTSNGDARNSLEAGMTAFLSKPVEFDSLLSQIKACLHLEWIYETPAKTKAAASETVIPPPPKEMETLHSLALRGNMRDILQWLTHLAELDPLYQPFAEQLSELARSYQSKALLQMVEQYMKPEQPENQM